MEGMWINGRPSRIVRQSVCVYMYICTVIMKSHFQLHFLKISVAL